MQDFASSFFNPNPEEITVTMTLVSDDPKFVFANGQVGTYTKHYKFAAMHGGTDNIYIGSPKFGQARVAGRVPHELHRFAGIHWFAAVLLLLAAPDRNR